ncbi:MAG: VTT domain-containing protein [Bacillota bacterium]|nr:VTT domain-containing protein [Bacillota bacterium]
MKKHLENNLAKKETIMKCIGAAMWLGLIIVILLYKDKITVDSIVRLAPHNGMAAAALLLAAFALKSITFVFYSGILFAASGILFPIPAAFAVNIAGMFIMLSLPYSFGRRHGDSIHRHIAKKYPKIRTVGDIYVGNDFVFAVLIRMAKVINYDLGSMYLGAKNLEYPKYAAGSALAMLPQMIITTLIGYHISGMPVRLLIVAGIIEAVSTIVSFVILHKRNRNH